MSEARNRRLTKTFDWGTEDRYRSNYGKGPIMARILAVANGEAKMERWHERRPNGRRERFVLRVSYLTSPRCGWRRTR